MSAVLHIDGNPVTLENLQRKAGEVHFRLNGRDYRFRGHRAVDGSLLLEEETAPGVWRRMAGSVSPGKGFRRVQLGSLEASISETPVAASHGAEALSPPAPMPGLVRQVLVSAGDKVTRGQPLVILEAMKLQLTLPAGGDATVEAVLVKPGQMVTEGAELVRLKAE